MKSLLCDISRAVCLLVIIVGIVSYIVLEAKEANTACEKQQGVLMKDQYGDSVCVKGGKH